MCQTVSRPDVDFESWRETGFASVMRTSRPGGWYVGSVARIPNSARAVLEGPALAHLVTLEPDGRPQVSIVWIGLDGDELVAAHLPEHRKVRNIRRDPRVALSVEAGTRNELGLGEYIVIQGRARITRRWSGCSAPAASSHLSRAGYQVPPDGGPSPWLHHPHKRGARRRRGTLGPVNACLANGWIALIGSACGFPLPRSDLPSRRAHPGLSIRRRARTWPDARTARASSHRELWAGGALQQIPQDSIDSGDFKSGALHAGSASALQKLR